MTPTEKTSYDDRASSMGLSLGHFSVKLELPMPPSQLVQAEQDALEAALKQLELRTARTDRVLDLALAEVRAAMQT